MARVRWTPTAYETLADIYEFLAVKKQNPDAADRLVQEIHQKSELYAGNPELGDRRNELGPRLRCFLSVTMSCFTDRLLTASY